MTGSQEARLREALAAHEGPLFGLAYRLLGSAAEAQDAVQETFLRYTTATDVEDAAAWLRTVCTRICLDVLRSARARREEYVGPWLPEPLVVDDTDPAASVVEAESLSLAFLVLLESLSPEERVAFLLHDVFGAPFAEVAAALGKSAAAARQIASRARRHVAERRPRFEPDPRARAEVADAFLVACAGGDLDAMLDLLAPDVVLTSDGGGIVSAARQPVHGAAAVARMLLGLARKTGGAAQSSRVVVNGTPGAIIDAPGAGRTVMVLEVADGRISGVGMIRNPAKLTGLGSPIAPDRSRSARVGREKGAAP